MNTREFKKEIARSLEKYYKEAISENIKRAIKAKKRKICRVNKSKV
jgi:hypothetical protein